MKKNYKHLSAEERAAIMIEHQKGGSIRTIAGLLGRSASTVSRELARNCSVDAPRYCATQAASAYRLRRRRCVRPRKLIEGSALYRHVHDHLVYWRWSPQQIAAKLRAMYPDDPSQHVSHETVYAAIYTYARGSLKPAMIAALRQEKPARGNRRTTLAGGSYVPEDLRIQYRPEQIEQRLLPGHWEGDFIKGAFNRSAVGTLVERKTRFVILCRMDGCTARNALEGFSRQMKKLPAFLRESLTYDRGTEMACHVELSRRLNIDIWFADPHAPWQRGSNENTNGLLRQFLPKGTDLSTLSQTQLNDIAKLLNGRPRQTLGWDSPEEAMAKELEKAGLANRCT
ncbi:Transposase and inactivated derivatives, IS30 family [Paraburkholderia tuberum]|uniref:Transposase and inactivated derivatives, IS30 family n=1 Tax=Paraburkholderia tuberum TaxID=157910 RepID=A0A1H1KH88_9BURK|nr:IS30 family transposase [Paraburkholderia tuberum]SDR61407.1 Transposase and inactivated derivatives, IS30 family [Paraburkholderia tuberum]